MKNMTHRLRLRATYGDIVSLDYDSLIESLREEGKLSDDWSDLELEVVRMPNFEDICYRDRILFEGEDDWRRVDHASLTGRSIYGYDLAIVLDDYSLAFGHDGDTFELDGVQPVYVLREGKDLMSSQYISAEELAHALDTYQKDTTLYNELLRLKAKREREGISPVEEGLTQ